MPLNIWQELANGVAPQTKAKPKPKPKVVPKRAAVPSYSPNYINAAASSGPSVAQSVAAMIPALPGSSGGMAGAAPAVSTAKLLAELKRQAQSQVAMELDPQIRAGQFARQEAGTQYKGNVADVQKRLGLTKTELTQLYAQLGVLLKDNAAKTQVALEKGKTSSNAAYDQLAQQVSGTYGQTGQNVNAELARIGQGGGDVKGRLAADQAFTSGQVGAQKANASSTIDAIKAASAGEAGQMQGAAAATAPALIGRATAVANDNLTKLRTEYDSTVRQLNFQIRQLTGSRKAKEGAVLRELQAAQAQADQDAQQLQFLNSIRAAQVGISAGQLDLAKQRLGIDVVNQQNSLVLRAKELQAKLDDSAAKKNAPKTGTERAYTYLASYKGRVPVAQLQQALEDAINGNSNDPGWNPGKPIGPGAIPGYDPRFIDQYRNDVANAVRSRGWTRAEQQVLANAIGYYFNR